MRPAPVWNTAANNGDSLVAQRTSEILRAPTAFSRTLLSRVLITSSRAGGCSLPHHNLMCVGLNFFIYACMHACKRRGLSLILIRLRLTCLCVCMCVCLCACMSACFFAQVTIRYTTKTCAEYYFHHGRQWPQVNSSLDTHTHTHAHACARAHTHTHAHMHTCTHAHNVHTDSITGQSAAEGRD